MQWYRRNGAKERDLRADAEAVEALARAPTDRKRATGASEVLSKAPQIGSQGNPSKRAGTTPGGPTKSILWRRGSVRSFSQKTQSGVVVQQDGTEVRVSSAALRAYRLRSLEPGESVWFEVGRVKGRQIALKVRRD